MRTTRLYLGIFTMAFLGSILGNSTLPQQAAAAVDSALGGYRDGHSTICYVETVLQRGDERFFALMCPGGDIAYPDPPCSAEVASQCTSPETIKNVKVNDPFICTVRYWRGGISDKRYGEREWYRCADYLARPS